MESIVVLCEAAASDKHLIAHAEQLVKATGGKLWLLHVAAADPEFIGYEVGPQHERDWRAGVLRDEHRKLQTVAEELRSKGVASEALLVQGETVNTALEQAHRLNADMLVIGTHHHGLLHRIAAGSTSDGIAHKASCPVLIVPVDE